jgi:hypothetical protein
VEEQHRDRAGRGRRAGDDVVSAASILRSGDQSDDASLPAHKKIGGAGVAPPV